MLDDMIDDVHRVRVKSEKTEQLYEGVLQGWFWSDYYVQSFEKFLIFLPETYPSIHPSMLNANKNESDYSSTHNTPYMLKTSNIDSHASTHSFASSNCVRKQQSSITHSQNSPFMSCDIWYHHVLCVWHTNMTGYISDLIWSQSRRLSVVVLIVVCMFVCFFVFVLPFCYLVYNTAVGACLLCGVCSLVCTQSGWCCW